MKINNIDVPFRLAMSLIKEGCVQCPFDQGSYKLFVSKETLLEALTEGGEDVESALIEEVRTAKQLQIRRTNFIC